MIHLLLILASIIIGVIDTLLAFPEERTTGIWVAGVVFFTAITMIILELVIGTFYYFNVYLVQV